MIDRLVRQGVLASLLIILAFFILSWGLTILLGFGVWWTIQSLAGLLGY